MPDQFVQFGTGGQHGLVLEPVAPGQGVGVGEDQAGDGGGKAAGACRVDSG
jgi:hypothetical protein